MPGQLGCSLAEGFLLDGLITMCHLIVKKTKSLVRLKQYILHAKQVENNTVTLAN